MGGLDKFLNQSLKDGLKKIGSMSSNGPLESCCRVLEEHLIGHVLKRQNGQSTGCFHARWSLPPHMHFLTSQGVSYGEGSPTD